MMIPALILLAASQAEPTEDRIDRLQWELQEMLTDEEWKPERVGVDEIPADAA